MKFSMDFARTCYRPNSRSSLRSIFLSFTGPWVKIGKRNRVACSESNPAQSSRPKSTTYSRQGRAHRFQPNSAATPDIGAQKLRNDVWHDYDSITTKLCIQIDFNGNAMFERNVETCIDWTSFDFRFEDFLSNLLLKIIVYCIVQHDKMYR